MKPRLFVLHYEIDVVVEADDETDAENGGYSAICEEALHVDPSSVEEITSTDFVPEGWLNAYPHGGEGDRTIAQILAADDEDEEDEAEPPDTRTLWIPGTEPKE